MRFPKGVIHRGASLIMLLLVLGAEPPCAIGDDDAQAALAKRLGEYLNACADFGWSGAALVAHEGRVVLRKGYGLAERDSQRENGADTLFEIASVTKVFTACAVMRLVELGTVGLDDPIAKHLPGVPEDKKDITIRHLLTHTSGVSRVVSGGGDSVQAAVSSYLSKPRTRKVGALFEYWNGGYALLAALIEQVTPGGYTRFCKEQVLRPAGMTSSGFTGDRHLAKDRQARGYDGEKPVRYAAEHPYRAYDYGYKGMGGVVATADDLWRFAQALLAGKIVKPKTRRLMEAASTPNQGLGWGVLESKRKTPRLVHGGDVRGFHTAYELLPAERAAIVVLSNVEGIPMWKIQWNLQSLMFGESLRYPVPPTSVDIGGRALDALQGLYHLEGGEGALIVEHIGKGLMIGAEGSGAAASLSNSKASEVLASANKKARAILDAVLKKDIQTIRDALPKGAFYAKMWPQLLVEKIWPAELKKWGALKDVRVIGVSPMGQGRTRVVLGLRHVRGDRRLQAIFLSNGALSRFSFEGPRFALVRRYMPVSENTFQTFVWTNDKPLPEIEFKRHPEGRGVTLSVKSEGRMALFRRE